MTRSRPLRPDARPALRVAASGVAATGVMTAVLVALLLPALVQGVLPTAEPSGAVARVLLPCPACSAAPGAFYQPVGVLPPGTAADASRELRDLGGPDDRPPDARRAPAGADVAAAPAPPLRSAATTAPRADSRRLARLCVYRL